MKDAFAVSSYITVEGESDCGKDKNGQTQDVRPSHTLVVIDFVLITMEINTQQTGCKYY